MKGKFTLRFGASVLLAALTFFSFGRAQAQVSFHLGGAVGPQYTTLQSNVGKYSGVIGAQAGISSELRIGQMFSTQLDILYSMNGASRNYYDSLIASGYYYVYRTYNSTERLTFIQPTLLFKLNIPLSGTRIVPYDLPDDNPNTISIFAGPYFGHLLSHTRSGSKDSTVYDYSGNMLYTRNSKGNPSDFEKSGVFKNDFGITAGVGMNFGISDKGTLGIDARFSKGFNNLDYGYFGQYYYDESSAQVGYSYAKVTNLQFGLLIAYRHRLF